MSGFNKASFVSSSAGEVDLDDPEFWTKVANLERKLPTGPGIDGIDIDAIVTGRRRRRKVKRLEVRARKKQKEGSRKERNVREERGVTWIVFLHTLLVTSFSTLLSFITSVISRILLSYL